MAKENMILIMVDECGSEVEVKRYTIGDELDETYIELWKSEKITDARELYPEARYFYFEDRRKWNSSIQAMARGEAWEEVFE